ncbi:MAG TPA: BlaI/MecI/CopY family transcriptional regulator [Terriglobia bacterium]|nr:BlaI/MecI/CopY family transcriptional regulator [Terriglobia bacterium]
MGRKRKSRQLTPLELKIMQVLWASSPATVQAVQQALPGEPRLAYTTVQTMLNVLYRKGKVKRVLRGRAFEYTPSVTHKKAAGIAIRDIIDRLFGGSAESLVMSLVESQRLGPEKLARLTRLIEKHQSAEAAKEAERGNS